MRQSETVVRRAWTAVVYIRPPGAKSELVVADEAGPSAAAAAAANAARPSSAVTRRITVLFTGGVRREVPSDFMAGHSRISANGPEFLTAFV